MKISNTSTNMYLECGRKYDLHYNKRLRPKAVKSALLFGKSLDVALNDLLLNRNLEQAKDMFYQQWSYNEVNGSMVNIPTSDLVTYSKADLDEELLGDSVPNNRPWASMLVKGNLMLEAYHREVLPKIKEVKAIQMPVSIKNADGDEIAGFLDLIAVWEDGRTLLLDNKSSSVAYAANSASESPQLALYYYLKKEELKLDGVGFIVLDKNINKNRKKICVTCGYDGSEGRHKTCPNTITGKKKCGGEYKVTIDPTCNVQYVINEVGEVDEDAMLERYDAANAGISNQEFEPNWNSCIGKFGPCPYRKFCSYNSHDGLVYLEKKEKPDA